MDRERTEIGELGSRLRAHVEVLAELIGERNTSRPSALDATRAYLRRELAAMGCAVAEQTYPVSDRAAINLEVALPARDARRRALVIGAHYDSARGTPGADDNASAVAILLEIARSLAARPLRRPVRIVFYDTEEPPYFHLGEMGSQHHAASLRRAGVPVLGMICLESLGYFGDEPGACRPPAPLRLANAVLGHCYVAVVSDPSSISFGLRFLARFATSGIFPFIPAALPETWVPHIAFSDHRGYWENGFPALMITNTALFRNPHYHKPTDRLATLDLARMTRLARQLQRAVLRMVT